jgi:putative transposase
MTLNGPTVLLVTVCTRERQRWLATPECHALLRQVWMDATAWRVGPYVLMPDHLHLFAVPGEQGVDLDRWVRYWKSQFSRAHASPDHRWQADYWDTRMRTREHFGERLDYVFQNPVRHKLVNAAEEWAYRGEIHEIVW